MKIDADPRIQFNSVSPEYNQFVQIKANSIDGINESSTYKNLTLDKLKLEIIFF